MSDSNTLTVWVASLLALLSSPALAVCQPQFSFTVNSATSFNYTKLNSSSQQTEINLQGKLSIMPVTKGDEQNWWAIKADEVESVSGQLREALPQYEHPFAFRLNKRGLITAFHFADKLDIQSQQQLQGLAYFLQYQKDLHRVENEQDNLGTYRVKYERVTDKELQFSKLSYQGRLKQFANSFSRINILDSKQQIVPATCFLNSRNGFESLELIGTDLRFQSDQRFQISKVTQPFSSSLYSQATDLLHWQSNTIELTKAQKDELRSELMALIIKQDITQIDAHTLSLLLKKFDAVINVLRSVIIDSKISDKAQMRLFNALGQLDTPSSQLLLSNLLVDTHQQPQIQFRALRALTQGSEPLSEPATDTLLALLNDGFLSLDSEVTSSFYMTLGIILSNRKGSVASTRLDQAIIEHITLSENDNKTADLITAVGNSRNENHVEFIDGYLKNTNARIEKAAIRALGMFQSERAYSKLDSHLRKQSGRNTKALISALGSYQMKPQARDSVLNFAVNNQDEGIRFAAIKALANQKDNEGIKYTLRQALQKEDSKRNFTAIVELIHSQPKSTSDN